MMSLYLHYLTVAIFRSNEFNCDFCIVYSLRLSGKSEMPFIWNDDEAEFLDDSAAFNRNQFVVVRKLFIQFKEHAKVKPTLSLICEIV